MKLTKKNKIVLITLAVVLLALFIVYFAAVAPLLEEDDFVYPIPLDGEGLYGMNLTVYKSLEEKDLVSIKVSNEYGDYTFKNVKNDDGKYSAKLVGYEKLAFDEAYYGFLLSFALTPITMDNIPYRNLTDEQMAEYGVTADTCSATMTVTYKDGNTEKTHVLRIGHESFTANPTYYVAYEGRNTAYRFPSSAQVSLFPITDYVSPIVYNGYESSSEALIDIIRFSISKGTTGAANFNPYILLTGKQYTSVDNGTEILSTKYTYHVLGDDYKIVKSTEADLAYTISAVAVFYTSFNGDKVVAINPDAATLDRYGLGLDDEVYMVNGVNAEDDLPVFLISKAIYEPKEKATYHYTAITREGITLVIRIPESLFIPADQFKDVESSLFDETKQINWAATNTMGSGFNQAIQADGDKYAGVKKITVKVPTSAYTFGEETFFINYVKNSEGSNILNVTTASGRYEDKSSEIRKPFNSFFKVLITYPIAARFNSFTEAQMQAAMIESNLMYSIEAEMNDGTVERYEYYKISTEYVMACVTKGEIENGQLVMGKTKCIFDVSKGQIQDGIYVALNQLMKGEAIVVN